MTQSTVRFSAASLVRRLGSEPVVGGGPSYRVLAHRIRRAVLDGRLAVRSGLPSERELAAALQLSRTTVAAAYALLREEGWLDSRRGAGSTLRLPDHGSAAPQVAGGPAGLFGYPAPNDTDTIDFTTASLPAPVQALQRATRRRHRRAARVCRRGRVRALRAARAAPSHRRPLHGVRSTDRSGPDLDHQRRAALVLSCAA